MEIGQLLRTDAPSGGRRRVILLAAGVVVAAVAVLAGAAWTPLFAVRTVEVEGAVHLSAQRVLEVAGIEEGSRAFLVDEEAAESRLEEEPWVLRATVTTSLPSRVRISIRERRPIAAVREGEGYVLFAPDGVALGPSATPRGLLVIESEATLAGAEWASGVVRAVATLERRVRGQVELVVAVPPGPEIQLVLASGTLVDMGSADDAAQKSEALAAVLRWAKRRGIRAAVVDVSAPGAPTIRTREGKLLSR